MTERQGGCWLAFYPDWSALVVFGDEISALRYAVENHMEVKWVTWGEDIR